MLNLQIHNAIHAKDASKLKALMLQMQNQPISDPDNPDTKPIHLDDPIPFLELDIKLPGHALANSASSSSSEAIRLTTLNRCTALHFAVAQNWLEGVMILILAGAQTSVTAQLTLPDDRVDMLTPIALAEILNQSKMLLWFNASNDPRDWFHDDWITQTLDDSTNRALFLSDTFKHQTEIALAKYQPHLEQHSWFESRYLLRYWLQTEHTPKLQHIKNDWKKAHGALRNFLFTECVLPHISEQVSFSQRLELFSKWQDYVHFLYTPACGYGNDEHSSFSSFWYSIFHPACPDWLKSQWQRIMRQASSQDGIFDQQFAIESKALIMQYPLLNNLDKLNKAMLMQNQVASDDFQPAILEEISAKLDLKPFIHLGTLLLPTKSRIKQRIHALNILEELRAVFSQHKSKIDAIVSKSESEPVLRNMASLIEAHKLLDVHNQLTPETLFLTEQLILELADAINSKPINKQKGIFKRKSSLSEIKNSLTEALDQWIHNKLLTALQSPRVSLTCAESDDEVLSTLRALSISGQGDSPRITAGSPSSNYIGSLNELAKSGQLTPKSSSLYSPRFEPLKMPKKSIPKKDHPSSSAISIPCVPSLSLQPRTGNTPPSSVPMFDRRRATTPPIPAEDSEIKHAPRSPSTSPRNQ
jgi:hypothetical protein